MCNSAKSSDKNIAQITNSTENMHLSENFFQKNNTQIPRLNVQVGENFWEKYRSDDLTECGRPVILNVELISTHIMFNMTGHHHIYPILIRIMIKQSQALYSDGIAQLSVQERTRNELPIKMQWGKTLQVSKGSFGNFSSYRFPIAEFF